MYRSNTSLFAKIIFFYFETFIKVFVCVKNCFLDQTQWHRGNVLKKYSFFDVHKFNWYSSSDFGSTWGGPGPFFRLSPLDCHGVDGVFVQHHVRPET